MMHRRIASLLVMMLVALATGWSQLQSPDQFLPHKLGEMYTPHHLLVDYFEHVAANSPQVKLRTYGRTYEQRPMLLACVSTPENLAQLEDIRLNNLRRAGMAPGNVNPALDRAIVWLSYTVHGNEAPGSEASMGVLYDLVNTSDPRTQAWLRNTIVIIEPCLNPDGNDRYTHWFRGVANRWPNAATNTIEHDEPWPRGRPNHYLFDLNRDWAWQTQIESRQRVAQYRQWLPHIHADVHEQSYDSPYYFAPAAQPYHAYMTAWQSDFQVEIGKNHARYFDQNGWLYFTREVFDLLYPSYGDTYPMFSGAIGMTYEQAGNSSGGRSIQLPNGDTLTLHDRVLHHRTTSLSTVEIASQNVKRLVDNFAAFYDRARNNPVGPYKTYVIKAQNNEGKLRAFTQILDLNAIQYGRAGSRQSLRAYDYQSRKETTVQVEPSDLIVSAFQPNSTLAQILLDPSAEVVDSLTYDITGWSLPYAYGLAAYASVTPIKVEAGYPFAPFRNSTTENPQPYAYVAPWGAMADARFLGELLRSGIVARRASSAFSIQGKSFPVGSIVITRGDNRKRTDFDATMRSLINKYQTQVQAVGSGMSSGGPDLGSDAMRLLKAPRVAVLGDEPTYANEFGAVWHYFEQSLEYPVDIYQAGSLGGLPLQDYNVLVMPEGSYDLSDADLAKITQWVRAGGKLIAVGDALSALAGKDGFSLKPKEAEEEAPETDKTPERDPYAGQDRRQISWYNPGAIFKVSMDATHPLASGLGSTYFSLKTNGLTYAPLEDGWSVGTLGETLDVNGFVGYKLQQQLKNTLIFGVQEKGGGSIVYLVDNPLFRGFWENGKLLFSNALFF